MKMGTALLTKTHPLIELYSSGITSNKWLVNKLVCQMAKSAKDKIQYKGKRCKFQKNGEGDIILSKVVRKSSLLWHLREKNYSR